MRESNTPTHFNWESVYTLIKPESSDTTSRVNDLDNDPQTLEREKTRFQTMLQTLSSQVKIDHMEVDKEGRDLFVLTVESMPILQGVRNLFKDAGVQYDVDVGLYSVSIKGRDNNSSMKPLQNTAFISRLPLKRVKRSFTLSLLGCGACLCLLAFIFSTFYRIVFT